MGAADEKRRFRAEFADLVHEILEESRERERPPNQLAKAIRDHLGVEARELPVHQDDLQTFELANLQLGLSAALDRPGFSAKTIGLAGQGRHMSDVSLSDLVIGASHLTPGPPEYVNAAVGPSKTLPCLVWALLLVTTPEGPLCVFLRRGHQHGPNPGLSVQVMAGADAHARAFLADLRRLMDENDVFRGQLITIEGDQWGGRRVVFLERPHMNEGDLVLPDGVLERIERHVVGPTRHRDSLVGSGRHLSRGLLLWGPPGTGKTHCVRYLTGRLTDATVIVLSGSSLEMIGSFGALARRLAPSVVILEDVDLVATERELNYGSKDTLFELMNEMSGLGEDADVAFVLTTNRPDILEPALAARPGRVDLAIEIPLPDAQARRRLLALYSQGISLTIANVDEAVARTAGATASFFRELLRKATLTAFETGHADVTDAPFTAALDELLSETATLTRVLLGHADPAESTPARPSREWMERISRTEPLD